MAPKKKATKGSAKGSTKSAKTKAASKAPAKKSAKLTPKTKSGVIAKAKELAKSAAKKIMKPTAVKTATLKQKVSVVPAKALKKPDPKSAKNHVSQEQNKAPKNLLLKNTNAGTLSGPVNAKAVKKAGSRAGGKAGAKAILKGIDSDLCREISCETTSSASGYCRLHYIKNWKKIKRKEVILREKKLNQYIEELVSKYPDKYIEAIRNDLADEKSFSKVIYDLELDEAIDDIDGGEDSDEEIIGSFKRDFEDSGEDF